MRKKNESGFTLLEIALVLVVAGLLVGAVLNSRGISETAKSFRLQKQVEELKVAVDLYNDRMAALPGSGSDTWDEDLYSEDLITSPTKATQHAFNDAVAFKIDLDGADQPFESTGTNSTVFQYDNVPAKWARTLIRALDDGESNDGLIQATATASPDSALNTADLDTAANNGDDVYFFVKY
jgi:prepilin-type N-terminal cleavage/methylation domain-containing protein